MKIAVCGNDRENVIKRLEKILRTEAVRPKLDTEHSIVNMAEETYGQTKRNNVVYDGCVLEYLKPGLNEEFFDVYEQIALTSLVNIDKIFVVTKGIDEDELNMYKGYIEFLDGKINFVTDETEVIL
jgi:hypothetical protein